MSPTWKLALNTTLSLAGAAFLVWLVWRAWQNSESRMAFAKHGFAEQTLSLRARLFSGGDFGFPQGSDAFV